MSNDVRVRITGDATGVKQATREASQSLAGLADNAKSLIAPLSSLFAGVSVGAFAAKLVQTQREFDVLNSSLITVTGSSQNAAREFAWIKEFAASTPYSLNEVTQAFVKMKALGLDASEAALRSYGNTASAMGKDLNQMIEAVADASTSQFERLLEFGVKAKQQGDRVSLTFQGVTKTIGNNAAEITRYLREIGDNEFGTAMAERAKTLDGALSNLGDSWNELFLTISKAGVGQAILDATNLASEGLKNLARNIEILSQYARPQGQMRVDVLVTERTSLQEQLAGLEGRRGDVAATARADMQRRVAAINDEIRQLQEEFERAEFQNRKLSESIKTTAGAATGAAGGISSVAGATRKARDEIEAFLLKLDEQEIAKAAKAQEEYAANIAAAIGPLEERARVLDGELETYGLTEAQIQQTIIARIEEARAIAATNGASEDHLRYLDREIEARKRIATAADGLDVRRANADAAREAEESWRRTADAIEDALIDALMEGGKSGKEYIEGLFRSMVLRPVVQAIVQPIAGGITSAMGFGAPGQASAAGGAGGMSFNPFSLLGGNSIGNMYGSAFGSLGSSSMLAGTGAGNWLTGVSGNAGSVSNLGYMGAGIAGSLTGEFLFGGRGYSSTGGSLGAQIGTAIMPGIGTAVGAVLGAALGSLLGGGKPSDKAAWATVNPTTGAVSGIGSMTGKKDPGQEARDATAAIAAMIGGFAADAGIRNALRVTTGARDGFRVAMDSWMSPTSRPGYQDQFGRGGVVGYGATSEAAIKKALNDLVDEGTLPQATITAWRQMRTDAQGAARDAQEQIDVLDLLVQGISKAEIERANTMQQAGETLAAAYARMVAVENAIRAAISQTFDTPAERLTDAFKDIGQAIPQTVDEYERLVRAQDLTTEAGRNQAAALLNVKGLWDEAQQAQVQAAEEAARAAEEALAVWARLRDDLTAFRADLTTGDLAGLSPEAAYRAAQAQFADTSRLARLGNQDALAQLAEMGRALLEASRAYNASTGAYFADRDRVLGAVDSGLALTGRKIQGFAGGGMFGGGLRIVGERGPELEATGPARIWNAQQTQAMLGGGAEVVRELQAVVRVLSTGLSSMDRRLANLERSSDEQARVARLAADRRAA